jgi:hypothetical protein
MRGEVAGHSRSHKRISRLHQNARLRHEQPFPTMDTLPTQLPVLTQTPSRYSDQGPTKSSNGAEECWWARGVAQSYHDFAPSAGADLATVFVIGDTADQRILFPKALARSVGKSSEVVDAPVGAVTQDAIAVERRHPVIRGGGRGPDRFGDHDPDGECRGRPGSRSR